MEILNRVWEFISDASAISNAKLLLQIMSWIVAAFIAILGASTLSMNFYYRRRDEKWSRLRKAESLVDDMYKDDYAHAALRMSDGTMTRLKLLDEFNDTDKSVYVEVKYDDVLTALSLEIGMDEDIKKATTICHCYDTLFYFLNRFEIYVREGLIRFDDVRWPLNYYLRIMYQKKKNFEPYVKKIQYPLAINFIKRFSADDKL